MCTVNFRFFLAAAVLMFSTSTLFAQEGSEKDKIKIEPVKKEFDFSTLNKHAEKDVKQIQVPYAQRLKSLDIEAVKKDLVDIMTNSKGFWPADYGHYGPFFIRLSWHSAGTYRALDGRGGSDGGQMRFDPLSSWPDNANLDKARELLRPLVEKYAPNLSWADAMVLAGDLAMRDMGFQTLGVALGRIDDVEPDLVYWGPEDQFLKSERFRADGTLMLPLAASVMGLIYVNPEGPDGKPDPLLSAERIRETFGRMGMNDTETVALIAGGHTFGKAHGAKVNTSGLEGPWTPKPIQWTHEYLTNLFKYDWVLEKGPGGKYQWYAPNLEPSDFAPDSENPSEMVPIMMLTTDIALKKDPAYRKVSERFLKDPDAFGRAFAEAWYKLIHRDMGPVARYHGADHTEETFIWQDPIPKAPAESLSEGDIAQLKEALLQSELTKQDLVSTAWASASTFRASDFRGGANGARIRLEPQRSWEANEPVRLARNLEIYESIKKDFDSNQNGLKKVSISDLIVLGGVAAIESAAGLAGVNLNLPFNQGRVDATQEDTDIDGFNFLKVTSDGFRNFYSKDESYLNPVQSLIDKADQLTLTSEELIVLMGGLRTLGVNHGDSEVGLLTENVNLLTSDYFRNLMNESVIWTQSKSDSNLFEGTVEGQSETLWLASIHDIGIKSNADTAKIIEKYAQGKSDEAFIQAFSKAWHKVMNLDRFDLVEISK